MFDKFGHKIIDSFISLCSKKNCLWVADENLADKLLLGIRVVSNGKGKYRKRNILMFIGRAYRLHFCLSNKNKV